MQRCILILILNGLIQKQSNLNEVILKNNVSINLKAVCITGAFNFELTFAIVHKYFLRLVCDIDVRNNLQKKRNS